MRACVSPYYQHPCSDPVDRLTLAETCQIPIKMYPWPDNNLSAAWSTNYASSKCLSNIFAVKVIDVYSIILHNTLTYTYSNITK